MDIREKKKKEEVDIWLIQFIPLRVSDAFSLYAHQFLCLRTDEPSLFIM